MSYKTIDFITDEYLNILYEWFDGKYSMFNGQRNNNLFNKF